MTGEVEGKLGEIKRWEYFKKIFQEWTTVLHAAERSGQMSIEK